MFHDSRKYITLIAGVVGGIFVVEALTNGLRDEPYLINKEPDIPSEHYKPLQTYVTIMAAGTTASNISGDMVNL